MTPEAKTYLAYLAGVSALYLLPLIISSRAKRDPSFASGMIAITAGIVFVIVTILYPIGALLVGPLSFAGYLSALILYLSPALAVLLVWVGILRLFHNTNHHGRSN